MEWMEILIGFFMLFGCGLGIFLFGQWAGKQNEKPLGFWANGKPLDPKSVPDIPGYNRAFGRLFRIYAVPFLLSGVMMAFSGLGDLYASVSLAIVVLWGIFGTWWLIHSYKQIEKQFIL